MFQWKALEPMLAVHGMVLLHGAVGWLDELVMIGLALALGAAVYFLSRGSDDKEDSA